MIKEIEQKNEEKIDISGYETLNRLSSDITDIEVKLQRAYMISDRLREDYFGWRKEYYESHTRELLEGYETAEAFHGIINDYLYDVRKMLELLQMFIEKVQKGMNKK